MIQQESDTISPFVGPLPDFELMAEEAPVVSLFEGHSLVGQNDLLFIDKLEIGNEIGFLIFLICSVLLIYIHRNAEGFIASVFRASFDSKIDPATPIDSTLDAIFTPLPKISFPLRIISPT